MSDMNRVIEPDSTQINADDFLAGPQTFTITGVKIRGGKEQPVEIGLKETDKFFRPCKSSCRAMVHVWGADSSAYVGRSLTLYCDKEVRWGGLAVGGIRISHMSDMEGPVTMALTNARGSKKPHTVRPLTIEPETDWKAAIEAADSLDALGKVWAKIPKVQKDALAGLKDARKVALTAASGD